MHACYLSAPHNAEPLSVSAAAIALHDAVIVLALAIILALLFVAPGSALRLALAERLLALLFAGWTGIGSCGFGRNRLSRILRRTRVLRSSRLSRIFVGAGVLTDDGIAAVRGTGVFHRRTSILTT